MRVFIVYDEEGTVVTAGQFEELHQDIGQPFQVANPKHKVVELDSNDDNFKALVADKTPGRKKELLKVHNDLRVNLKTRKLYNKQEMEVTPAPTEPKPPVNPKPPIGKPNQPGDTPPTQDPTNPKDVSEK